MMDNEALRSFLKIENIPVELTKQHRWVCWSAVEKPGKTKFDKVPFRADGKGKASSTDPGTWDTFSKAVARWNRDKNLTGIGFVLGKGIAGIDLDKCRNPETDIIQPWATKIIHDFRSYTEISPSGTGVKIFCYGAIPPGRNREGDLEMYSEGRFFTVTGNVLSACVEELCGTPWGVRDCRKGIAQLHEAVFGTNGCRPIPIVEPLESTLSDDDVLRLIRNSRQANKFNALWEGNFDGYPSQSEADMALCLILAFWCGRDAAQMDQLFRQSGLFRPKKWDRRHGRDTYGNITIEKAISKTPDVFQPKQQKAIDENAKDGTDSDAEKRKPSQSKVLVELSEAASLFHTTDGDCYAVIPFNDHSENWPIRSKTFKRWLSQRFHALMRTPPGSQALSDAMNVVEGRAQFDGPEHKTFVRLASKNGTIYLDLADAEWRCVEITPKGWKLISNPPVRFIRPKGLTSLPVPAKGGSLEDLRTFLNCADESSFRLMIAVMVQMLNPDGPYPVIILEGEQGSAKSTTSKIMKSVVDPNLAPIRSAPRDELDLIIAATNSAVLAYDNLSGLPNWLSDAMCRLATGGGIGTRELYTNGGECIFSAMRPLILNGIDQIASRHDLADRSIIITLPAIPEHQRIHEKLFWGAFDQAHPHILGALLTAVSTALKNIGSVKMDRLPRMADFALWVTAAESALPWGPDGFLEAYDGNRKSAVIECLAADPVACALQAMITTQLDEQWNGTATALLCALKSHVPEETVRSRSWPKDATRLSKRIKRNAAFLRHIGIHVEMEMKGNRKITITKSRQDSKSRDFSASSARSA